MNKSLYSYFLSLLTVLLLSINLQAQHKELSYSYNQQSYIPSDEVYNVIQDSTGRLFVATDQGVYVVHGEDITQYTVADGLVSNTIFKFYKDSKSNIWALTFTGGLCYFDGYKWVEPAFNKHYNNIRNSNFPYYFNQDTISGIYYFDDFQIDNVFYSVSIGDSVVKSHTISEEILGPDKAYHGYELFSPSGQHLFTNRVRPPDRTNNYRRIVSGELYLNSLGRHEVGGLEVQIFEYRFDDVNNLLETIVTLQSQELAGGYKIFSTSLHIWLESPEGDITLLRDFPSVINSINLIEDDIFVNLYKQGSMRFAFVDGELILQQHLFEGETVSNVFKDRQGSYWVSLAQAGLSRVVNMNSFEVLLPEKFRVNRFAKPLYADDTYIAGIGKNNFYVYNHNLPLAEQEVHHTSFPDNYITSYHYNHNSWYGKRLVNKAYDITFNDDFSIQSFKHWARPNNVAILSNLQGVQLGGDSTYIYVHRKQIWSVTGGEATSVINDQSPQFSCENVLVEGGKVTYVASTEGLLRLDENGFLSIAYPNFEASKNRVTDITDAPGKWKIASTKESGILVFSKDSIFSITIDNYLPEEFITSLGSDENHIYADLNEALFVAKLDETGVATYHSIPHRLINVTKGIQSFTSSENGVFLEQENKLIFLSYDFIDRTLDPIPYRIEIDDDNLGDHYIENGISYYTLPRGKSNIDVILNTSSPFESGIDRWRWRTANSETWNDAPNGRITLTNLRTGLLNLEVQHQDENGVWDEPRIISKFLIRPNVTETWWFWSIALSPILVLLFFTLMNSIRSRRLNRELIESNMSSLKMQINPHFIFNSFNSIQYLIRTNKNDTASEYLSRLAKLIRKTIERPNLHRITLEEELEYINEFISIEAMRLDHSFTFNLVIDDGIDTRTNYLPPMLLQPILENAVWYGMSTADGQGEITVRVESNEQELKIHIIDNGPGFPLEKWSKVLGNEELRGSLGLKNVVKRLELLTEMYEKSYKLELLNSEKGTHFVLTLAL